MPIAPPMNDAYTLIPSARPASPLFASACPSMTVITDGASPGMPSRIDVTAPPNIAP